MKTRFYKGLKITEPIILKFAVSMSNEHQTKSEFGLFIDLVNRQNNQRIKIQKLEIILSCYLQRYYYGEDYPKKLEAQWRTESEKYLSHLKAIELEIIEWKTLIEKTGFIEAKQKVDSLYKEDSAFTTIVNNLATRHANKADHESAKKYLLEECAVFLNMNGHVAYPGTNWNEAVDYVLKIFSSNLIYHGYCFYKSHEHAPSKEKPSTEIKLLNSCLKTTKLLNKFGVIGEQNQAQFFKDFLALKNNFSPGEGEKTYVKDQNTESSNTIGLRA